MNIIFDKYKVKYVTSLNEETKRMTTNKYIKELKKEIKKGNVIKFKETSDQFSYTIIKRNGESEYFFIAKSQNEFTATKKRILESLLNLNNSTPIQAKIAQNEDKLNTNFSLFKRFFYKYYDYDPYTFKIFNYVFRGMSLVLTIIAFIALNYTLTISAIAFLLTVFFFPKIIIASISLTIASIKYCQIRSNSKYELPLSEYKKIKRVRKYTPKKNKAKELEVSIEKQIIALASKLNKDIMSLNDQQLKRKLLTELDLGLASYQKDLIEILSHENKPEKLLIYSDKDLLNKQFLASLQVLEEKISNSYQKDTYPEELQKLQTEIKTNLKDADSTLARARTM